MNHIQRSISNWGCLLGLVFTSPIQASQQGAYLEEGALVAVELEDTAASGYWIRQDSTPGFTGLGALEWTGANHATDAGNSPFAIEVIVKRAGRYQLRTRSLQAQSGPRFFWVRIDGGPWQRALSKVSGQWTWSTHRQLPNAATPAASTTLTPGRHLVEISPGSDNLLLDRLHTLP